jgi:hypothetical protein
MFVILKSGYRYSGKLIEEDAVKLILDDIILGKIEIDKEAIAVRGGETK